MATGRWLNFPVWGKVIIQPALCGILWELLRFALQLPYWQAVSEREVGHDRISENKPQAVDKK